MSREDYSQLLSHYYTEKEGLKAEIVYYDPYKHSQSAVHLPAYEVSQDAVRYNHAIKVGGFHLKDFKDSEIELYNMMDNASYDMNVKLGKETIAFRNSQKEISGEIFRINLHSFFKLRGKNNRTYIYLKNSWENGVIDGKVSHSISFLEDVSYLGESVLKKWSMYGYNAEAFDFEIPELKRYLDILTTEEIKILRLLARGFNSSDIANALKKSRHTVDTHRRNMLKKLEVANTPELIDIAKDLGLY